MSLNNAWLRELTQEEPDDEAVCREPARINHKALNPLEITKGVALGMSKRYVAIDRSN